MHSKFVSILPRDGGLDTFPFRHGCRIISHDSATFNSVHSGFGKMYLIAMVFTTMWDEHDWQTAFVWKSAFEIRHVPCVI